MTKRYSNGIEDELPTSPQSNNSIYFCDRLRTHKFYLSDQRKHALRLCKSFVFRDLGLFILLIFSERFKVHESKKTTQIVLDVLNCSINNILMLMTKLQKIVQKLNRLALIERKRYQNKGMVQTIIGCFLMVGLMWLALALGKQYWPQHIRNKEVFILGGSVAIYYIIQTLGLIIFLPAYLGYTQIYDAYKIQSFKELLQKNQQNIKEKPELYITIIKKLIFNQFVILPIAVFLVYKNKISVEESEFPSLKALFLQIQFMNLTQDLVGFVGHRLAHSIGSFSKMHKIHHDFNNKEWWVSQYFHPLEPVCSSLIMSLIIYALTGNKVHCIVIFSWICWKNLVNTENHAGYQFQWSPTRVMPFVAGPSYHAYHHTFHMQNYAASCYIWDIILDTNTYYMNKFLQR